MSRWEVYIVHIYIINLDTPYSPLGLDIISCMGFYHLWLSPGLALELRLHIADQIIILLYLYLDNEEEHEG